LAGVATRHYCGIATHCTTRGHAQRKPPNSETTHLICMATSHLHAGGAVGHLCQSSERVWGVDCWLQSPQSCLAVIPLLIAQATGRAAEAESPSFRACYTAFCLTTRFRRQKRGIARCHNPWKSAQRRQRRKANGSCKFYYYFSSKSFLISWLGLIFAFKFSCLFLMRCLNKTSYREG